MAGGFGFARPKPGSKLSTRIDADGREVEVEVREDEEQEVKLQEIIDLLLAAGYFRARIKGLSPFDKVVGGMTWCIETCNFDVDIDLLFQENLTIGQKIALTEKIVAVLPRMKCPHRIEPHQIQGLDFIHIFPVVQWLVKRAIETREEMGDFIRSYSVSQFNKHYSLPEDNMQLSTQEKGLASIRTIKKAYHPQRKFRMKDAPPSEEEPRVRCTLLEYGYSVAQSSVSNEAVEGSGEQSNSQKTPEMQDTQKAEELQIQALLKNMSLMEEQEGRLTAGVVGNLVNLKADEIVRAAEHYAELQAELEESSAVGGSQTHARLMSTLQKQKAALEEKEMQLVSEKERLQEAVSKSQDNLQDVKKSRQKIEQGLSELQTMETEENQGILKRLQALVVMNESLKQQEQQFREQCKVELSKLQNQVKDAEANATPDEDNEIISQQYESVRARLQQQRLLLAKRTRSIAGLQRQLDEVPGRAELAQYQRRFMELYNQVAAKHKETKQFYTLYNTLDDTKLYLSKELTLLNSILDNYTEAMAQPASREQFMKQFDAIVEGIKQNKSKVEHRRQEERLRRDRLSQQLLGLVEQQRRYVAAVRQLTIECRKNEVLLAQLRGT